MECVLSLHSFVTSVAIRILFGITQLLGTTKEALQSRLFVPMRAFDCGLMQETTSLCYVTFQVTGGTHDGGSVEHSVASTDLFEKCLGLALLVPIRHYTFPIGVMAS